MITSAQGKPMKTNPLARTITGQVLSGSICAAMTAGCILAAEWASMVNAVIIASSVGYGFSLLTLCINALLEQPAPEPGDPPRKKSRWAFGSSGGSSGEACCRW